MAEEPRLKKARRAKDPDLEWNRGRCPGEVSRKYLEKVGWEKGGGRWRVTL